MRFQSSVDKKTDPIRGTVIPKSVRFQRSSPLHPSLDLRLWREQVGMQIAPLHPGTFAMTQRTRDLVGGPLSLDYFMRRAADGWTLAAVEWVREVEVPEAASEATMLKINVQPEEIPYGLRISEDGFHLEENPVEKAALLLMLERIVMEKRLSQIAEHLNLQGLRTRRGTHWTSSTVFDLLPRLIEIGPKLLNSRDWRQGAISSA